MEPNPERGRPISPQPSTSRARTRSPPPTRCASGRQSRSPNPHIPSDRLPRREPAPIRHNVKVRRSLYLLGYPLHQLAPNRLPTNGEVCRRVVWAKSKWPTTATKFVVSCPTADGQRYMKCLKTGECERKGEFTGVCILREILSLWDKGGYNADFRISEASVR